MFNGVSITWRREWSNRNYKNATWLFVFMLFSLTIIFPFFFSYIEHRQGFVWNDYLLSAIQPRNCSVPVFSLIWLSVLLILYRSLANPIVFIKGLSAYVFLSLTRMLTLLITPLDPPAGLIELRDPLTNYFYGGTFISKDLFFSGHTATLFLFFLIADKPSFKYWFLASAILVGAMLLIQHVHYTMDILFAFPFAWQCQVWSTRYLNYLKILV